MVGPKPSLAKGGDVVETRAVHEEGVVVPDDGRRVDGEEVGEGDGRLGLGSQV